MADIEPPFMWFSQPAGGTPEPWRYFQLDGLLLNAYEILQKAIVADRMRTYKVHSYLDFHGPVMMDSGGFMFMTKKHMKVKPEAILELYGDVGPNYGVVLDHPLTIGLTKDETKRRQLLTLRNTKRMIRKRAGSSPELIPVIHGHTLRSVEWFVRQLAKIGDFEIYGIGSLVPSVFNAKGVGGINNVIRIVSHVRKLLPGKLIHVFGVGSTITMHLMFASGADSLDSSSWRSKAGFGIVQLPGIGDRYITGRAGKATGKKYLNLSKKEVGILEECHCPACKRLGVYGLRRSFSMRALHNCWVFQKEVEKARKLSRKNEYLSYVDEIVGKSRFSNALQLARSLG
jgi:7-cyano-7-deazaguanine tRNA-ribosyltransferase